MLGFAVDAVFALDRASVWSPALRLHGGRVWVNGVAVVGGTADFAFDGGGLDLCPLRLAVGPAALRPCAALTAGRVAATGRDTFDPATRARFGVGAGGTLAATVDLGRRLVLTAVASGIRPLRRDKFAFSPDIFYEMAAVGLDAELGLAVRFP